MKQDRFLMGILIFIGILVIAAVTLFFIRRDTQTYTAGDTPEGVIHNYALAIQQQDYERAYSYLANKDTKPDYAAFRRAFLTNQLNISNNAIQVGQVQFIDENDATVSVMVLYAGNGPFSEGWNSSENASLVRQEGAWKLTYMPFPYWAYDWFQPTIVPAKPQP